MATLGLMESTVQQDSTEGSRLGEFHIQTVLGKGGSGTVYAARWGHRSVALKVLRKALVPSEGEQQRFLAEARILADVNHPAMVKVLGFGELPDGRPYLAMERLDGETLAQRLRRGPLKVAEAVSIFHQLAGAVQTLHERGLIHRDIKPENVFCVEGGEYAVLLDFGIAKALDAPDSTVTRDGGVRGTPAYMAPERFFGTQANTRTDIYELALTLYAMVTGQLPWSDPADPMARLNPGRPSDTGAQMPGTLETEMLSALSTRAEGRPESVKEFAERILAAGGEAGAGGKRRTADIPVTDTTTLPEPDARLQAEGLASAPTVPAVPTHPQPRPGTATSPLEESQTTGPVARRMLSRWQIAAVSVGLLVVVGAVLTAALVWSQDSVNSKPLPTPGQVGPLGGNGEGQKPSVKKPLSAAAAAAASRPRPAPVPPRLDDALVFKLHPRDSELIFRLSHAKLQQSSFYKTLTEEVDHPQVKAVLGALRAMCAFDPLTDLQWFSFGLASGRKEPVFDAAVRGAWTRADLEQCIIGTFRLAERKVELKKKGRLTRIITGGRTYWLAWPDDHTFYVTNRKQADQRYLEARLAGKQSAAHNRSLNALYKELDGTATMWMTSTASDWMKDTPFKKLSKPRGVFAWTHIKKEITFTAGLRYGSAAIAAKASKEMNRELKTIKNNPYVGMFLTKAEIRAVKSTVRISMNISETASVLLAKALVTAIKQSKFNLSDSKGKKGKTPRKR